VSTTPQRMPDWFDAYWEANKFRLPIFMRNDNTKQIARSLVDGMIQTMAQQATTPAGIRALISFAKITAVLKSTKGVMLSPDPTPEEVAEEVRRLVERVRP
jgi:hypothetical protein